MNIQQRTELMRTALGNEKADLVIANGTLVNVYTGELLEGYGVAVRGERIAYVGKDIQHTVGPHTDVIDATGKTMVPGFIDSHTHLSIFCPASEVLRYIMRGGTTTIVTELIEMYFSMGYEGVIEYLVSCKDQPIRIFGVAPPMITLSTRVREKEINKEQLRKLLQRDDILGLGEAYWLSVVGEDRRLLELIEETLKAGKIVAGHSAGAKGNKLAAYVASGVSSCHEPITAEEVIERLRLGIYVQAREGETRQDLETIAGINYKNMNLSQLLLVTDTASLKQMVEKGYMEVVLQKAIDSGFEPITAIQMATINAARYLNLDDRIGGIAPGKYADIVIIPDLRKINAEYVISNGQVIARDRELLVQPREHTFPDWTRQSIRPAKKFTPDDFMIRVTGELDAVTVRVIEQVEELVTQEAHISVPLSEGMIKSDPERDLLKISCIDYQTNPVKQFVGLIKGFKMKRGAIATTMAWDLTNIIALGADEADLALAVNRVVEMRGGAVVCADNRITAEIPLPVGGYISDLPIEEVLQLNEDIQQAAADLGSPLINTHLTLMTLTSPAIPFFRICEEGLFNIRTNSKVELIV